MANEQITLWLDEETAAALRALARKRKVRISSLAERFIRAGLGMVAAEQLEGPALPAVRQVVQEITGKQADRIAKLVVKGVLEAGLDRRLTYALLDHHAGSETARRI